MKVSKNVCCPQCQGPVYRNGKEPKTGLQRYRCKDSNCKKQFVPGRPNRRKYPKIICPKCGSNMSIYKHLSDALRFRCNRYALKGDRKCSHKVNIPLPGKTTFDSVKVPSQIRLIKNQVQTVFHWNKMKFSSATVAIALYYSIFQALPAPSVVNILNDVYNIKVSHDTITRWTRKAAFLLADQCAQLVQIPPKRGRPPRILADETQIKCNGKKRWFWLNYLPRHDLYLGHNLTPRRNTQAARDTFAMTFHQAPALQRSEILTDGLWSYGSALGDLRGTDTKHYVYRSFFEQPNNNRLERKWSNFKTKARLFRGFKSDAGLYAFLESQIIVHNLFKPSSLLKGLTPFQSLGISLPKAPSNWQCLMRLLTS